MGDTKAGACTALKFHGDPAGDAEKICQSVNRRQLRAGIEDDPDLV
jgi:hypothetical protein